LGATDTFEGRSNTAYKTWLQEVQPTAATHEYASFINKKVAAEEDGLLTTGTVQCPIKEFCRP
jgi:heme oxygenase